MAGLSFFGTNGACMSRSYYIGNVSPRKHGDVLAEGRVTEAQTKKKKTKKKTKAIDELVNVYNVFSRSSFVCTAGPFLSIYRPARQIVEKSEIHVVINRRHHKDERRRASY